ncbi:MAG: rod shape-determining protein MreD [Gammaproteobacteria bacterium]
MKRIMLIAFTIMIAFILTMLPLPVWAQWIRPAWVPLVVLYWAFVLPNRVGLILAWFSGLMLDVVNGTILGEHALALSILIYCALKWHLQMRVSPLIQQSITIGVFMLAYQVVIFLIQGVTGNKILAWQFWLLPLLTIVYWPWLYVILQNYRQRYKLS